MRGTGGGGGEIVEVHGGHIVRSIGRKDRHSKVCTAKGPRDRRVRLSAHTAIQFYDVQDRLGYDRPSKAVDWLIKKAKAAIDELAELPAWNPTATPNAQQQQQQPQHNHNKTETENPVVRRCVTTAAAPSSSSSHLSGGGIGGILCQQQQQLGENPTDGGGDGGGFLPPPTSLDVDIADTIRSFFPTTTMTSSPIQFQSFPPDLLSRTSSRSQNNNSNNQDLRLSLQSFQDPILLHQHQAQAHHHQHHHQNDHVLFSGTAPLGFDAMVAWNAGVDTGNAGHGGGGSGGGGGFMFNTPSPSPSPLPSPAAFFGQSQYLSQRGPLQSSNTPSIRAWIDAPSIAAVADHHQQHHHYLLPAMVHQSSSSSLVSGIGFASGGFSGFRVPARIQGEEEHDGVSDKPSSASSDSRR